MADDDVPSVINRLELSGDLSRHETEALLLELRHLARRHGLRMREVPDEEAKGS
jgi:hypothetical protein